MQKIYTFKIKTLLVVPKSCIVARDSMFSYRSNPSLHKNRHLEEK